MTRSPTNIGDTCEKDFLDAVRLSTENAKVDRYNAEKLSNIGKPVTRIMAIKQFVPRKVDDF